MVHVHGNTMVIMRRWCAWLRGTRMTFSGRGQRSVYVGV
jgi:hypothetical protein